MQKTGIVKLSEINGEINATILSKSRSKNTSISSLIIFVWYLNYSIAAKIFNKSLVDGEQADSMTKLRKAWFTLVR